MKCLIIDDEKLALELLEDNVRQVPFLTLAGSCRNSFEVITVLKEQAIDLIFLDIKMPGISGLELIKSLQNPPLIILVTAFEHHAIEAFELNVVDYLLKPVSFDRFLLAANKALDLFMLRQHSKQIQSTHHDHIFVNASYSLVKVRLQDIIYIEGLKDYVKIHLIGNAKPVITRINMRDLVVKLPSDLFMRIHKSFIIALDKIESIQKYKLVIADREIPIGESYREILQLHINKRNI
ncbi:MAG: DNA-binding response regulator [Sphingobacteriales bacterium]|nr:DNA-binding response regulator [Daejeonella sp.]MDB5121240.1 DNA-binding response regulator [Sphingobacteriales bacterium]